MVKLGKEFVGVTGRTQDFKLGGSEISTKKKKKKYSNAHSYITNKLSTNTNTQNQCFLIY